MAFLQVECAYCHTPFSRDVRHVHENYKLHSNFYCSPKCQGLAKSKQIELICSLPSCGRKFKRTACQVGSINFCCKPCFAIYNNHLRMRSKPIKRCIVCGKQVASHRTYCSSRCCAKNHQISKDQLLGELQKLAAKLGRPPSRREFPQYTSCTTHFGSWNNAIIQAGLQPHRSLNQRMYKRRICTAKDGHKCNSVSELIIDNWLFAHHIEHDKEAAYPLGKFVADWKIGSKALVEYFGLAIDSKRYDECIVKKRRVCQNSGFRLIEIYSRDLFPKNRLGVLFGVGQ